MASNPQKSNLSSRDETEDSAVDNRLSPGQALTSTATTATTSRASSIAMMEKDVEKTAGVEPTPAVAAPANEKTEVIGGNAPPTSPPADVNPMDPSQFPEGGLKAWTVVFGAACGLVVSFGWINCTLLFVRHPLPK